MKLLFTAIATLTLIPALSLASGSKLEATGLRGTFTGTDRYGSECELKVSEVKSTSVTENGAYCREIVAKVPGLGTFKATNKIPYLNECGRLYSATPDGGLLKVFVLTVEINSETGKHTPIDFRASKINPFNPLEPKFVFCRDLSKR